MTPSNRPPAGGAGTEDGDRNGLPQLGTPLARGHAPFLGLEHEEDQVQTEARHTEHLPKRHEAPRTSQLEPSRTCTASGDYTFG